LVVPFDQELSRSEGGSVRKVPNEEEPIIGYSELLYKESMDVFQVTGLW
jgi:hypothetical protein